MTEPGGDRNPTQLDDSRGATSAKVGRSRGRSSRVQDSPPDRGGSIEIDQQNQDKRSEVAHVEIHEAAESNFTRVDIGTATDRGAADHKGNPDKLETPGSVLNSCPTIAESRDTAQLERNGSSHCLAQTEKGTISHDRTSRDSGHLSCTLAEPRDSCLS